MISVLIALYGIGMIQMLMLIQSTNVKNFRKWAVVVSIFFWPIVIVVCYVKAVYEVINEKLGG